MENQLIVVKQLPIIEEQLRSLKLDIESKVALAKSLVCTEDTVKDIKKTRAEFNKRSRELESQRIEIKNAIMGPYNEFEKTFKDCVTIPLASADKDLKNKIDEVENVVRKEKANEVSAYFKEYAKSKNIEFLQVADAKINITLTVTVKKLKEQVAEFIDKVCDDLELIETQESKAEILVEYKKTLNCSQAITTVTARKKAIEEQKKADEERKARVEAEKIRRAEVARIASEKEKEKIASVSAPIQVMAEPPKEIENQPEVEKIYTLYFTVKGTKTQLKELKEFLENGGYDYE